MSWNVVFHIDELDKWNLLIGNINNFLNSMEGEVSLINVVVNASAVCGVIDKEYKNSIKSLCQKGVQVECCKIALAGNGIDEKNLPAEIIIIPSGIKRLVELQHKDYSYIKP